MLDKPLKESNPALALPELSNSLCQHWKQCGRGVSPWNFCSCLARCAADTIPCIAHELEETRQHLRQVGLQQATCLAEHGSASLQTRCRYSGMCMACTAPEHLKIRANMS